MQDVVWALFRGELEEAERLAERALSSGGARHYHEVVALPQPLGLRPESLPQQALHAVALDRAAELPPHGDAQARVRVVVGRARKRVDHQVAAGV